MLLQQLEDLKWQLAAYQKKCNQYAEEVAELRGDLHNSNSENQLLTEKLRVGIKRGDVYIRDSQGSIFINSVSLVVWLVGGSCACDVVCYPVISFTIIRNNLPIVAPSI